MKRVEEKGTWSLFCPNEAPGLADTVGDAFVALYERYEAEGRARKVIKAADLWMAIITSQSETGTPYMLYKDACNLKSNQQNLGVIKSSNLCTGARRAPRAAPRRTHARARARPPPPRPPPPPLSRPPEIIEYTSPDEIAVCNLASIAVNMFVDASKRTFDFAQLIKVTKVVTRNLNKVIDVNYYPVPEAERSNKRHRPIGIGIQGFADALALLRFPFESPEACALNRDIFEAIYFGAVDASCELAEAHGAYASFAGSPASQGRLQFDMWGVTPSAAHDWAGLKARIAKFGLRNSLLLAPMPTASTAQILGNNESFEPFTTNLYNRRVLAGEFCCVNKHLLRDLIERGLWSPAMRMQLLAHRGSVQAITSLPAEVRDLYKTVWEIKQKTLIDYAADRGAFICQSQSLNLFMAEVTLGKLSSAHFHAWRKGLKTGMYYLRTRAKAEAIPFTIDQIAVKEAEFARDAIVSGFDAENEAKKLLRSEAAAAAAAEPATPAVPTGTSHSGRRSRRRARARAPPPPPSPTPTLSPPRAESDAESVGSPSPSSGSSVDGDAISSELTLTGAPLRAAGAGAGAPDVTPVRPSRAAAAAGAAAAAPGGSPDAFALAPGAKGAAAPQTPLSPEDAAAAAAAARAAANEAKKAALREQMKNGQYFDDAGVCTNCSS